MDDAGVENLMYDGDAVPDAVVKRYAARLSTANLAKRERLLREFAMEVVKATKITDRRGF